MNRRPAPVFHDRMTRAQRRHLNRQHGPALLAAVDPAAPFPAAPPSASARRGLVRRARATIVRRHVRRTLARPAMAPLVAVAVVAVLAAVAIGALLGAAVVAAQRGDGAL